MGRQPKQGLDYFPFDVGLLSDPKLRRPRQKYGYLAQMVYIALLCILYRDKGYYIPYGGEQREDVIWQVGDALNGRYTTTAETIANVIDELAACGLFSDDLFRRDIITSIRAQKAYYTATVDRKYVDVNFDIWLLSEADMRKLSSKSVILQSFISRPINTENRPTNGDNQPSGTQSREQKSREKQRTEKYSKAEQSRERAAALAADLERLIGTEIDDNFRLDIARLMQVGMQEAVIMEAARQTGRKRPRNPAAYAYVLDFRAAGELHDQGLRKKARLVESCVFTPDKLTAMGIPEGTVPLGWWVGFYVDDDETWEKIKNGTYTMFSIEGRGEREPVAKSAKTFQEIVRNGR